MIIDFHNHYYPPAYLKALRQGPSNVKVTIDDEGNPLLHYPGDYNIVVRGHRDIEYRQHVLEETGIDKQILTPGMKGVLAKLQDIAARGLGVAVIRSSCGRRHRDHRGKDAEGEPPAAQRDEAAPSDCVYQCVDSR